jgi:hypothetical protein
MDKEVEETGRADETLSAVASSRQLIQASRQTLSSIRASLQHTADYIQRARRLAEHADALLQPESEQGPIAGSSTARADKRDDGGR